MGYFANGTEGEIFVSQNCVRCAHWKLDPQSDTEGCPVYDAHFLYNHDQFEDGERKGPIADILSMLIPSKGIYNDTCAMLQPVKMIPDRVYTPPMPEAYRLLATAKFELERAVEASEGVATHQLEANVQPHYAPDHECTPACEGVEMDVWLANMSADHTAKDIGRYLETHAVPESRLL